MNHTFSNLNQQDDPNPFVSEYKGRAAPKPHVKPEGYEREDVI